MSKIVVVYHSGYGHTQKIAEAVAAGAGAQLAAIDAQGHLADADWAALNAADAIVFGTPTYMGNASWQFKKFADASSKAWFNRTWQDKLAAGFTNSASLNGDKGTTLAYLQTLANQHGMLWVSLGLLPANNKAATRADLNNLGGSGGLLASTPSDASTDEMVDGDLATAKTFGERIKAVTERWAR